MCLETLSTPGGDPGSNPGGACKRAVMPCCDREGATMAFCLRCVEIVCQQGPGHVGRCPKCRGFVKMAADGRGVELATLRGTCVMCRQDRQLVDSGTCDACALGMIHRLRYECQRCGGVQMIPHPMWRYQPTPAEFGHVSWACHVSCGDYTKWRVTPADMPRVPLADAPESWGVRDEWLAGVRQLRRRELEGASTTAAAAAVGGRERLAPGPSGDGARRHGGIHGYGGWRVEEGQGPLRGNGVEVGVGWWSGFLFVAAAMLYFSLPSEL